MKRKGPKGGVGRRAGIRVDYVAVFGSHCSIFFAGISWELKTNGAMVHGLPVFLVMFALLSALYLSQHWTSCDLIETLFIHTMSIQLLPSLISFCKSIWKDTLNSYFFSVLYLAGQRWLFCVGRLLGVQRLLDLVLFFLRFQTCCNICLFVLQPSQKGSLI
jgi:hypothetical protein